MAVGIFSAYPIISIRHRQEMTPFMGGEAMFTLFVENWAETLIVDSWIFASQELFFTAYVLNFTIDNYL